MSDMIGYPEVKRLCECLYSDPDFIDKLSKEPALMSEKIRIDAEPDEVLKTAENIRENKGKDNPYSSVYRKKQERARKGIVEGLSKERFSSRVLHDYGDIVRNRMMVSSFLIRSHPNIWYYPVIFELTEGCSQHCPFCALDAGKLSKIFLYTKENSVLWREVLGIIKKVVGPASDMGICYFATEPLDNPDYELFIRDYKEELGRLPQTTTALSLKDPERIRRLILGTDSEDLDRGAVRFSIRTLDEFYRVMSEYSPDELADIDLISNNPESGSLYSASGRRFGQDGGFDYSIACIAGLRVNMASKTVCFEEADMPDEDRPTGERIYETLFFEDGASFEKAVLYLIETYARDGIRNGDLLKFDRCVDVKISGNEASLEGNGVRLVLTGNYQFMEVLRMLKDEELTMDMIGERLKAPDLVKNSLLEKLDRIYRKGYLRCIPHRGLYV